MIQHREWEMVKMLKKARINCLRDKKILDVGCEEGRELINLIRYGARPENLYGIDLLEERIITAKNLHPYINLISGDGSKLPYLDEYFDIVMQFTVFTSILDKNMKKNI